MIVILVEMPDDAVVAVGQAVLGDEPLASAVSSAQCQDSSHFPRRTKVKLEPLIPWRHKKAREPQYRQ